MFHRCLGADLAAGPGNDSRLHYTSELIRQRQAAVKLHGVFAFRWTVLDCALVSQFHRLPGGDSRALVGPSCKSPIKRQGITLTSVAFRDLPIAGGGPRFLVTSPCRHGGRTVSSPLECGDRRTVSEGSDLVRGRPSLRIVRTLRLLPIPRYAGILGVSRKWPTFIKATPSP